VADEKLFRLILENSLSLSLSSAGSSGLQKQLYIIDARPRANAYANAAKGGGIENLQGYPQCKFEYLGIPNIHVIRERYVFS
jgi:myotubularin-related protein 1/2